MQRMGQGSADGPAAEEAERRREEAAAGDGAPEPETRLAVVGCTEERPDRHVLGWADEVDADALFASGLAWGIRIERRRVGELPRGRG